MFVPLTGIIRPSRANWWASQGSEAGKATWSIWDEIGQSTLLSADYTNKTHIQIFDNINAGGNGTGYGVVSGANLVYTDVTSDIPGAAGTPLYRQITQASTQKFTFTTVLQNILDSEDDWLVMMKASDLATAGNGLLLGWNNAAILGGLAFRRDTNSKLGVVAPGMVATATADNIGAGDDEVYIAVWRKPDRTREQVLKLAQR